MLNSGKRILLRICAWRLSGGHEYIQGLKSLMCVWGLFLMVLNVNWADGYVYKLFTFTFIHLADTFIVHSGYTCFELNPQPFCAANAMLYHWATGTLHHLHLHTSQSSTSHKRLHRCNFEEHMSCLQRLMVYGVLSPLFPLFWCQHSRAEIGSHLLKEHCPHSTLK